MIQVFNDIILLWFPLQAPFAFCLFPKMESLLHMSSVTWSDVGVRDYSFSIEGFVIVIVYLYFVERSGHITSGK